MYIYILQYHNHKSTVRDSTKAHGENGGLYNPKAGDPSEGRRKPLNFSIIYNIYVIPEKPNGATATGATASNYTAAPPNQKEKKPKYDTNATNRHLRHLFYKLFPRERDYRKTLQNGGRGALPAPLGNNSVCIAAPLKTSARQRRHFIKKW
jgi:hypothetical protein